jgi:2-oxo-4-hydroxy-4-carboxy-5-ureidoimidazoline decarboxylase
MDRVTLDLLNAANRGAFVAALGAVMEHAPWIADEAFAARPFLSVSSLYQSMVRAVRNASDERQLAFIKGHPELAGKVAREAVLTADSAAEQRSVGLDRLTEEEFATFQRLNDSYRAKFGFPFVICVRRHGKDSILRQFSRRLENNISAERETALSEIFHIAALRLDQRVDGPDRLNVHGKLSTHVLDTHAGRPAAGVAIEFCEIMANGTSLVLVRAKTDADGRTERPLVSRRPIPIATYELRFAVGDYFTERAVTLTGPRFLDLVPVRFAVAEPEGHYHVPLLVTPWAYSTYRGS